MPITIANEDITFVVQGPVQASSDRKQIAGITHQCLSSIRSHFPGSTIILSTWKGSSTENLEYDVLVESEDPGANIVYHDDTPVTLNNNRQIVSTHNGLKKVKTQYAVKLRTDNLITGRQFVSTYEQYSELPRDKAFSFFKQRTLTTGTFFLSCHYGLPVSFHKSDLFDFGLTEDLLKIWPNKLINEPHFSLKPGYKARYPATEQFLCLSWLSEILGQSLSINNKADDHADLTRAFWPNFLANNIIVDSAEHLGIDVTERFYKRGNLSLEYDLQDWLVLNNRQSPPNDWKRLARKYNSFRSNLKRKFN